MSAMISGVDDSGLENVIDAELMLLRPEVRGNRERLEAFLDHDFMEIGASGQRWQRSAIIDALTSSPALEVTVAEMDARRVADGIALVSYVTVTNECHVLRSSWWRQTDGQWRCFFHQATVAPSDG